MVIGQLLLLTILAQPVNNRIDEIAKNFNFKFIISHFIFYLLLFKVVFRFILTMKNNRTHLMFYFLCCRPATMGIFQVFLLFRLLFVSLFGLRGFYLPYFIVLNRLYFLDCWLNANVVLSLPHRKSGSKRGVFRRVLQEMYIGIVARAQK